MGWIYTMLASGGKLLMVWGLKQPHKAVVFIAWAVGPIDNHVENRRRYVFLIGENLADEEYIGSMIDFGAPLAVRGEGRLLRLEASYRF